MSVVDEILRLQQAKSDLATSIAAKGVTVPATTTIDGYAALVDQIQQGGAVSYDSRIEYLCGDGAAWIDTGIKLGPNLSFKVRAYYDTNARGGSIFGTAYQDTSINNVFGLFGNSTLSVQFNYAKTNSIANITSQTLTLNQWYSIQAGFNSLTVNGTTKTGTERTQPDLVNYNIMLFGRRTRQGDYYYSKIKISSFQIRYNGGLVRDFIPVRVGQVGYMYDLVSASLFGNAGAGSFTLGPDVT